MGRDAAGVIGIRLARQGDAVVSMSVVEPGSDLLVLTETGYGKRVPLEQFRVKHRGGQGVRLIALEGRKTGLVAAVQQVTDADGRAYSFWGLGSLAGQQRVEARVVGSSSGLKATFTATALVTTDRTEAAYESSFQEADQPGRCAAMGTKNCRAARGTAIESANVREKIRCLSYDGIALGARPC